jgi:hypothetical protein
VLTNQPLQDKQKDLKALAIKKQSGFVSIVSPAVHNVFCTAPRPEPIFCIIGHHIKHNQPTQCYSCIAANVLSCI